MANKRKSEITERAARSEAEELDTLNVRLRRKTDVRQVMEAAIEEKTKKKRTSAAPAGSTWKPGVPN